MEETREKRTGCLTKWKALLTRKNQALFFLLTLLFAALSLFDVCLNLFPSPVSFGLYICAALCFFSSCALWVRAIRLFFRLVLIPFTQRNTLIRLFIRDYRLQTVLCSLPGVGLTMVFAVYNGWLGITRSSYWFGALAVYYTLLCSMRFHSVLYAKSIYMDKNPDDTGLREWKTYRSCGILLSLMSIALSGAVLLLVVGDGAKSYPGMMIYFMAAYTFYKLIFSIVHMKKARRERSLLSITLRNINHCEALVTLLSLQSAMFTAFSGPTDTFVPHMNAVTGGTVCLISLCLGLVMVYNAYKEKPCTGREED